MKPLKTKQMIGYLARLWLPLLVVLIFSGSHSLNAQTRLSFRAIDSLTYHQYLQAQWKELIETGNHAISQGHDYYFMRMRLGIAYYMRQHYRVAAKHFEKALAFNSSDPIARKYLQQCYEWGGQDIEAAALENRFPLSSQTDIQSHEVIKGAAVFVGGAISGSKDKFAGIDLDGQANIYGEVGRSGNLYYAHAGLTLAPANHLRWYLGYTHLQLAKQQCIVFATIDTVDNNYTLKQNQLFGSLPLRVGKGWSLTPAFSLIHISDRPYSVKYNSNTNKYTIRRADSSMVNYVASLKLIKDLPRFRLGVAVSKSFLNSQDQLQATFISGIYPFANLNLYAFSNVSALVEGNTLFWHFKQDLGTKILPKLWIQGSYHFGYLKNAQDENTLLVYNTIGKLLWRTNIAAYILLTDKLTLQIEYALLLHQDQYLEYQNSSTFAWKPVQYHNHHIMGGLKWIF